MKILVVWGLATAVAALVSGLKAARHRQWRRAAITFAAALACIVAVWFLLIQHGNVMRRVNQMQPTSQPLQKDRDPATADDGIGVHHETVGDNTFTVVTIDLRHADLGLFWKRSDGTRFDTFSAMAEGLRRHGKRLIFATNAGIFDPTFTPCGLHVESGRELVPINLASGQGNFYMKPNGVFALDDSGAHIVDSTEFSGTTPSTRLATQSGPLLLIDGQINPQFNPQSPNRKIRSAIGVSSPSTVYFVLPDQPVSFYSLASLLRTRLGCRDALYMDGVISRFYLPALDRTPPAGNFAGMFAVTAR